MKHEQVVVGEFENEIDAEIAKGHLESAGIEASVIKDDAGGCSHRYRTRKASNCRSIKLTKRKRG